MAPQMIFEAYKRLFNYTGAASYKQYKQNPKNAIVIKTDNFGEVLFEYHNDKMWSLIRCHK